jgi:hypothetical protein
MIAIKPPEIRQRSWEVIDIELAHVFVVDKKELVKDYQQAIEEMGHRALIKEVSYDFKTIR